MNPTLDFDAGVTLGEMAIDAKFCIAPGSVSAIFGASGAGKSTLLALVAGALQPMRGRIRIDELTVAAAGAAPLPLERRGIGWVFQDGKLFPHLSVRDNLLFGSRLRAARPHSLRLGFDMVVEVLGLAGLLGRHPRDLSGGERQRTAIGRALLSQPRLLLLDEPLASLDAARRAEILDLLARVRDDFKLPMLYVTHSLGEVLRIADRLLILERGRMLAEGAVPDLIGRIDTPLLAARRDVGALVEAPVHAQDAAHDSTQLDLGGVRLTVPGRVGHVGSKARVYILANEVMLATQPPQAISVRNVLPAVVTRLAHSSASTLVELHVGQHVLLASLTQDAIAELAIAPGSHCFALIKSVAIDAPAGARLIDAS